MIASPDNFQAIIMNKRRENQITLNLKIYNNEIETPKSVSFNQHISKLRSKAAMQLNAI